MNNIWIPIGLAILAVLATINAYTALQKGGSRFFELEREAILRRAGFTLLSGMFLFLAALGVLIFQNNTLTQALDVEPTAELVESAETQPATTTTEDVDDSPPTVEVESVPPELPTRTPFPTEDPNAPTPTPAPIVVRAYIEGTGGSGVYLRERPGTDGDTLEILDEGALVTLSQDDEPVEANGLRWLKVRDLTGTDGWVADLYLDIQQ